MLMNRRRKTLLPTAGNLLMQKSTDAMTERQQMKRFQRKQEERYNRHAKDLPPLEEGDTVRIKPFVKGKKEWEKGIVRTRLDE